VTPQLVISVTSVTRAPLGGGMPVPGIVLHGLNTTKEDGDQ
jgi:hypothetical protein